MHPMLCYFDTHKLCCFVGREVTGTARFKNQHNTGVCDFKWYRIQLVVVYMGTIFFFQQVNLILLFDIK